MKAAKQNDKAADLKKGRNIVPTTVPRKLPCEVPLSSDDEDLLVIAGKNT